MLLLVRHASFIYFSSQEWDAWLVYHSKWLNNAIAPRPSLIGWARIHRSWLLVHIHAQRTYELSPRKIECASFIQKHLITFSLIAISNFSLIFFIDRTSTHAWLEKTVWGKMASFLLGEITKNVKAVVESSASLLAFFDKTWCWTFGACVERCKAKACQYRKTKKMLYFLFKKTVKHASSD